VNDTLIASCFVATAIALPNVVRIGFVVPPDGDGGNCNAEGAPGDLALPIAVSLMSLLCIMNAFICDVGT
jgi:hypothetical protein